MRYSRVTWRQGNSSEVILYGPLWDAPVSLEPGESRQVSRALNLPVRRGEYYVTFIGTHEPNPQCPVAFKFADEFFD